jgi:metal-responsive CopG/Arc/MetJ family transcriptional regulator
MTQLKIRKKNVEVINIVLSSEQYTKLKKLADENGFSSPANLIDDIVHSYFNKHRTRIRKTVEEYEKSIKMPVQISQNNWHMLSRYSESTKISKGTFIHLILREIIKKIPK